MKTLVAAMFASTITFIGVNAAGGCGPGCHTTRNGACLVDGWGRPGVRNECPATSRPRRVYDPSVHYYQVRDSWAGVRTPDGR